MGFTYRVIPFIGKIKNNQSAVDVSDQLEIIINEEAIEYRRVANTGLSQSPEKLTLWHSAQIK